MRLYEVADLENSILPDDVVSGIKSNITKGAKDREQQWADALELTNKAFAVSNIQTPTPAMEQQWEQYQKILTHAVSSLSKFRPNSDWRITDPLLRESDYENVYNFKVTINDSTPMNMTGASIADIITATTQNIAKNYEYAEFDFVVISEDPMGQTFQLIYTKPIHIKSNTIIKIERTE